MLRLTALCVFLAVSVVGASAADLSERINSPFYLPEVVETPTVSWAGPYVGGHLGYGHSSLKFLDLDGCFLGDPNFRDGAMRLSDGGFLAGVHAGYNWQTGSFVYGVEGDLNWFKSSSSKVTVLLPHPEIGFNMNFLGTARARAGLQADRALIYATAGLAFADIDYYFRTGNRPTDYSDSGMKIGWAAGVGVDYALSERVSLRFEYMHAEFSRPSFKTKITGDNRFKFSRHGFDIMTVGLSFHL